MEDAPSDRRASAETQTWRIYLGQFCISADGPTTLRRAAGGGALTLEMPLANQRSWKHGQNNNAMFIFLGEFLVSTYD
jgi:hypothetical protein